MLTANRAFNLNTFCMRLCVRFNLISSARLIKAKWLYKDDGIECTLSKLQSLKYVYMLKLSSQLFIEKKKNFSLPG